MTPKEKANELVDTFRIVLMNEDTDCGNEILCTLIAKQCALIAVDFALGIGVSPLDTKDLKAIKTEIEKL